MNLHNSNATLQIGTNDTLPYVLLSTGTQDCPPGQFVYGLTIDGVKCMTLNDSGGSVNATNFYGDNFFGGNFYGIFNWVSGDTWNTFNGTTLTFNETKLNETILSLMPSQNVSEYEETILVSTSGGSGTNISLAVIGFEVSRITVTPSSLSTTYHFNAYEQTSLTKIDVDRKLHTGVWDIYKHHSIDYDYIAVNVTSSIPDDTYTIKIRYLNNNVI